MVRLKDRDFEMFGWLIHLKHMNLIDTRDAFFDKDGNPRRAPYRRFLKLMKEGYIKTTKIPTEPKDLYIPSEKAVKLLRDEGIPWAMGLSKDKEFAHYRHDRVLIRLRILFEKELKIGIWVPERVIRSIKPRGACPDALLVTKTEAYAIEYERTEKKLERYKEIFERYKKREHYDFVLYITESKGIIKKIEDKFWDLENIFFITREELFEKKDEALFSFRTMTLPLKRLIQESRKGTLSDLEWRFLRKVVLPKPDESWKERKPYIPWPKGGGGKMDDGGDGRGEQGDSSVDPSTDPSVYGDAERKDKDEENEFN